MGARDPKSDLHAYSASILLTEPPPKLCLPLIVYDQICKMLAMQGTLDNAILSQAGPMSSAAAALYFWV